MKKILPLLITLPLLGCADADDARALLVEAGYTDISLTGYNALACSGDDYFHFGFTATNPQGETVKGTICSDMLFRNARIMYKAGVSN